MTAGHFERRSLALAAEPLSARRARAFVAAFLADRGLTRLCEDAVLLASELVTNCVLHARTSMTLDVALVDDGRSVRIGVTDGSPVIPRLIRHSRLATTGRGLAMVRAAAGNFGIEPTRGGKTIWFELPTGVDDHAAAGAAAPGRVRPELPGSLRPSRPGRADRPGAHLTPGEVMLEVWLLEFPLDLYRRTQEHVDGLIRELAMMAQGRSRGGERDLPERLLTLVEDLGVEYAGIASGPEADRDAAIDRGDHAVDLCYTVPGTVGAACVGLGRILDEADEYCAAGRHLLTLVSPPEALAFRRWFIREFVAQIAGGAPTPWQPSPSSR